ncbi:MAG: hypothetical protein EBR91_10805 [Flavobacteriia bacterium]|nr:hypothetical protein [Flavobacteriia bacterium]
MLLVVESKPLIVALVPRMDPLTVICDVVIPLLNTGVAFTVNVLDEFVPSTVLLLAESNPLIVELEPTCKLPLTVTCDTINPLLNTGLAFTVNVFPEFDPIVTLLFAISKPLIVALEPIIAPLTVT